MIVDVDIQHLDPGTQFPCEVIRSKDDVPPCGKPATHWGRFITCHGELADKFMCTECLNILKSKQNLIEARRL